MATLKKSSKSKRKGKKDHISGRTMPLLKPMEEDELGGNLIKSKEALIREASEEDAHVLCVDHHIIYEL